ncbi:MAG TPA: hypothetical protein VNO70_05430 [Blastocatellia bacterium]|nr:hypothetical protein [Blastocatellia bacterium]
MPNNLFQAQFTREFKQMRATPSTVSVRRRRRNSRAQASQGDGFGQRRHA